MLLVAVLGQHPALSTQNLLLPDAHAGTKPTPSPDITASRTRASGQLASAAVLRHRHVLARIRARRRAAEAAADAQEAAAAAAAAAAAQAQASPSPAPPAPAQSPPAASQPVSATGFEACVIAAESGGSPTAYNSSSGASGLFGFLLSTWQGMGSITAGYPGGAYTAPASVQEQAFQALYASAGTAPWAGDGCA